jgi:hypothetical protein
MDEPAFQRFNKLWLVSLTVPASILVVGGGVVERLLDICG